MSLLPLCCACAAISFLLSCDNPAEGGHTYDVLTLLKPVAGAEIKAGSTVTVEWGYPENWPYQQIVVDASVSNSAIPTWVTISENPVTYPHTTFTWTVPTGKTGDSCRIKIYDYDKNVFATSGYFRVTD
jgi:hypothetical protein